MSYTKEAALAAPKAGDHATDDDRALLICIVHGYDPVRNRWLVADEFEELHEISYHPSRFGGWWDWNRTIPFAEYLDTFEETVAAWLDRAVPPPDSYTVFGPDQ